MPRKSSPTYRPAIYIFKNRLASAFIRQRHQRNLDEGVAFCGRANVVQSGWACSEAKIAFLGCCPGDLDQVCRHVSGLVARKTGSLNYVRSLHPLLFINRMLRAVHQPGSDAVVLGQGHDERMSNHDAARKSAPTDRARALHA